MEERPTMADQRAANLLGALALAVSDVVIEAAREEVDGPSASGAIVRIGKYPGQPIEFLSRALQLSHSATVRLVDRLQAEGLVRRERAAEGSGINRRSVTLYLTPKGERFLEGISSRRYDRLRALLGTLSGPEQAQLTSIMEKLLAELARPDNAAHICRLCDAEACEPAGCPVGYYPPRL
jgi:MarR family transcriptional regulator, negative regulator of the multidrug operon emrRAB